MYNRYQAQKRQTQPNQYEMYWEVDFGMDYKMDKEKHNAYTKNF